MIRLPSPEILSPDVRFALALLVDHARLLPADGGDVVELEVVPERGEAAQLDVATQLRHRDGAVQVTEGALRLVTRIAGVVDEQRSNRADRFGRVPPEDNWLASRGREREPVVSRFAAGLREAATRAAGSRRFALLAPWPDGRRWAMAMTHDLDVVRLWPVFTALRTVELARKGRIGDVLSTAGSALAGTLGAPVWNAAKSVLDVERRLGIRGTWFVITGTPTLATMRAGDVTYSPESPATRRIVDAALAAGAEIGLHGSFETWTHAERFEAQRHRLSRITGKATRGVRQHFLRLRPGTTHAAMHDAGFEYDSSCGFADRNGFRSGTADVHPAWHDAARAGIGLEVVPFGWMDRALSKYRGIEDPAAWVDDALAVAHACREVEGVWNGIWHPNLAGALGFPGAEAAFARLCERLMTDAPWSATLDEIVRWRRLRRLVRAAGTDAGGRVLLAHTGGREVALEDPRGRAVPSVRA